MIRVIIIIRSPEAAFGLPKLPRGFIYYTPFKYVFSIAATRIFRPILEFIVRSRITRHIFVPIHRFGGKIGLKVCDLVSQDPSLFVFLFLDRSLHLFSEFRQLSLTLGEPRRFLGTLPLCSSAPWILINKGSRSSSNAT